MKKRRIISFLLCISLIGLGTITTVKLMQDNPRPMVAQDNPRPMLNNIHNI